MYGLNDSGLLGVPTLDNIILENCESTCGFALQIQTYHSHVVTPIVVKFWPW
jgi:hypothetical protein